MSAGAYLDYNATTPLDPRVLSAMQPYFLHECGNPSSLHRAGQRARAAIDRARRALATTLHAQPDELIFTSGATEANNMALRGLARAGRTRGRHLITCTTEHPSVLSVYAALERDGFTVTYVPTDETGRVDPDAMAAAIRPETILVSVMAANNEVGTLQPIRAIGDMAWQRRIPLHVDAAQAFGRVPINVDDWYVSTLTVSGHKACGPKGVGALYVRRGVTLEPILFGGQHERGVRPGTEHVPGIVGLGETAEIIAAVLHDEAQRLQSLRDQLYDGLRQMGGMYLNGHPTERLCNTLNMHCEGLSGEAIAMQLDLEGVAVSTGAACSSGKREPSHVLLAMGRSAEVAQQSVRFSIGRFTTAEDIVLTIDACQRIVQRLRLVAQRENRTGSLFAVGDDPTIEPVPFSSFSQP